jgi:hypothetical protein
VCTRSFAGTLSIDNHINKAPRPCEWFLIWAALTDSSGRNTVDGLCAALNLESVQTAEVIHRTKAFGIVLKHRDGWSLTCVPLSLSGIQPKLTVSGEKVILGILNLVKIWSKPA